MNLIYVPRGIKLLIPALLLLIVITPSVLFAQNAIVTENLLPGSPPSEWDLAGKNPTSTAGFATSISVNKGETVHFKIKANGGATVDLNIYRLGYYQGNGARMVADLGQMLADDQPEPSYDAETGLFDCGNWNETISWTVPANAVSGIYLLLVKRTFDPSYASHVVFIVRDDAANSPMLVKTSDATWQAYNVWGGNSFYLGMQNSWPQGRANKISYNRPFKTREGGGGGDPYEDWLFNAEYPMIRFLERNGYDLSYTTDKDMDSDPNPITPVQHKAILSVGHDEYWSLGERNRIEAARDAGVHLAFFSANEAYWKTRWENNHRTLVCYKEGTVGENVCGYKCDPLPDVWTGLWRSGMIGLDGNRPENSLTAQIGWRESIASIQVPDIYHPQRLWRNTEVADLTTGQTTTLSNGTLGYEWDQENAAQQSTYPAGRVTLSNTITPVDGVDFRHQLALYRARPSNALVFGAGTVQWSWGLDAIHDPVLGQTSTESQASQQFTVNLFTEMGLVPATPQANLTVLPATGDLSAPVTQITTPLENADYAPRAPVVISGTVTDAGGIVGGVEISMNNGVTWTKLPDAGFGETINWSYTYNPLALGTYTVKVRSFDDLGNLENPDGASTELTRTFTVTSPIPCTSYDATIVASRMELCPTRPVELSLSTTVGLPPYRIVVNGQVYNNVQPGVPFVTLSQNSLETQNIFGEQSAGIKVEFDGEAIEAGTTFKPLHDGYITGVRFNKGTGMDGEHNGFLYTSTGQRMANALFVNETALGWQEVLFSEPVEVTANTQYVVTYHAANGRYAVTDNFFQNSHYLNPGGDLEAMRDNEEGAVNGRYRYGEVPGVFPTLTYMSSNYWVDVLYRRKAVVETQVYRLTSITDDNFCNQSVVAPATSLSEVTIRTSASCEALPVRFISFTGQLRGTDAFLNWSTAMESINDKFEIERSDDAGDWKKVGTVKGSFNSMQVQYYSFTDKNLEPGTYRYRLKQVDMNENFSYSNTIIVELLGGRNFQLAQNSPNPLTQTARVEYYVPIPCNLKIMLLDVSGRPIRQLVSGQKEPGRYQFTLEKKNLPAGVYLYRLTTDKISLTRKMIVQ